MMDPLAILILTGAVALAVGILIGRLTGNDRQAIRELKSKLESASKERELAQASVDAAKDEIKRTREQLDGYRGEVVEHFTGTSQLLRDLTHQYREVYDHLATGASSLCPEGSVDFLEGLQPERLSAGEGDAAVEEALASESIAASDEAASNESVSENEPEKVVSSDG
jgi:uncharacterized membrane-anchored protein YhcB (DUF1043 family)